MVCGGLRWFSRFLTAHGHTDVLSSQILVVVCGGLRWCVVVCGGLWWFVVDCGGLSFSHTRLNFWSAKNRWKNSFWDRLKQFTRLPLHHCFACILTERHRTYCYQVLTKRLRLFVSIRQFMRRHKNEQSVNTEVGTRLFPMAVSLVIWQKCNLKWFPWRYCAKYDDRTWSTRIIILFVNKHAFLRIPNVRHASRTIFKCAVCVLQFYFAFLRNYCHENRNLKGHCIEFKYYADGIHSGLTPPG